MQSASVDIQYFICGGKRFYVGEQVKSRGSEVVRKSVIVEKFGEKLGVTDVAGVVIGESETELMFDGHPYHPRLSVESILKALFLR